MTRLENVEKNTVWNTLSNIVYNLTGFVGRYVFLLVLDETYLGISSLFTSIIGVLSFADLGLNTAFTFCFYRPIEDEDIPHIQSILNAFRKVLMLIAGIILLGGLALIPFLRKLIKGGENISDQMLVVYYLITLANTVISYWLVYKTCYITAAQQAYRLTPFKIAASVCTVFAQLLVLITLRSYVAWALCSPIVAFIQYVVMNIYISKTFPETNYKSVQPLPEKDKKSIYSNVKAALIGRIGEVFVNQTDNIIISSMISISVTGFMSNYVLIQNAVMSVVTVAQNAIVPGLGSLIASEDDTVQKNVLHTYMFLNYCMVGFALCGISVLATPFISLVFGREKAVDELTVFFMCVGFYFAYQTYALNGFPTAAGRLILVTWIPIVEGLSNLVFSIWAAKKIGLPGVYLGTVISQLINYVIRGCVIYRGMYKEMPKEYFSYTLRYFGTTILAYVVLVALRKIILGTHISVGRFLVLTTLTPVVFFGTAWLIWRKSKYGSEAFGIIFSMITDAMKRNR